MKKWKIHFIPQTHWDKEWYFTKHVSDIYLIDNIDKIYEIYKRDKNEFKNFVYDGQYSIIDDYLEYYPENKYKIEEMVKDGALILGPWYTQTDTINAQGESIVRNLLMGTKLTEKLGKPMKVAYLPDSFGFNSNLPQIINKSGLKAMVHWRGIQEKQIKNSVYNVWKGIDNSVVPIVNLFKWGYGVGVGPSLEKYKENWTIEDMANQAKIYYDKSLIRQIPVLQEVSKDTGNLILMPFGSDQLPIYDGFLQMMSELNKIDNENEWVLSNYDEYIDELLEKTKGSQRKILNGELKFGQYSRVHKTITSSRYDIKQKIKKLENLLFKQMEPLSLIFEKMGGQYPANILNKNLKRLLECQAHDSLGGCNTDLTNSTILERLNAAIDNLSSLSNLMIRRIVEFEKLKKDDLLIFNLEPIKSDFNKQIKIITRKNSFSIFDENNKKIDYSIIKQEHVNIEKFNKFKINSNNNKKYPFDLNGQFWTEINLKVKNIEALSWKKFKIVEEESDYANFDLGNSIENEYYKIELNSNGNLDMFIKNKNLYIKDAYSLMSEFDAGDLYDFSPSSLKPGKTSKIKEFTSDIIKNKNEKVLNISYTFICKKELDSEEEVEQFADFSIILKDQLIDFTFNIDNVLKDAKWSIICKTNIASDYSYGDTSFGISKRTVDLSEEKKIWKKEKWQDCPIEIESMESVCFLKDANMSYAIFTKGTNEYQVIGKDYSELKLTLFKGVSFIGRRYLEYRPGRASGIDHYPHPTPEGNLNKNIEVKFACYLDFPQNVVKLSKEWAKDALFYQVQEVNPYLWPGDTFVMTKRHLNKKHNINLDFEIDKNLVISCFKKSFNNDSIIIRIYNPTEKNINFNVPKNWVESNLMEEEIALESLFTPNCVRTFKIKYES